MTKQNEWAVPSLPPPLFVGKKERDYIKQTTDELVEKVVGQAIIYYPLDIALTKYHPLYGEAINKTYLSPVRVYALIEFTDEGSTAVDNFGVEKRTKINVHFTKRRLTEDQDLMVKEGDMINYNDVYYEIASTAEPKTTFGQIEHKIEITATCVRVRYSAFNAK